MIRVLGTALVLLNTEPGVTGISVKQEAASPDSNPLDMLLRDEMGPSDLRFRGKKHDPGAFDAMVQDQHDEEFPDDVEDDEPEPSRQSEPSEQPRSAALFRKHAMRVEMESDAETNVDQDEDSAESGLVAPKIDFGIGCGSAWPCSTSPLSPYGESYNAYGMHYPYPSSIVNVGTPVTDPYGAADGQRSLPPGYMQPVIVTDHHDHAHYGHPCDGCSGPVNDLYNLVASMGYGAEIHHNHQHSHRHRRRRGHRHDDDVDIGELIDQLKKLEGDYDEGEGGGDDDADDIEAGDQEE